MIKNKRRGDSMSTDSDYPGKQEAIISILGWARIEYHHGGVFVGRQHRNCGMEKIYV